MRRPLAFVAAAALILLTSPRPAAAQWAGPVGSYVSDTQCYGGTIAWDWPDPSVDGIAGCSSVTITMGRIPIFGNRLFAEIGVIHSYTAPGLNPGFFATDADLVSSNHFSETINQGVEQIQTGSTFRVFLELLDWSQQGLNANDILLTHFHTSMVWTLINAPDDERQQLSFGPVDYVLTPALVAPEPHPFALATVGLVLLLGYRGYSARRTRTLREC